MPYLDLPPVSQSNLFIEAHVPSRLVATSAISLNPTVEKTNST